MSDREVSGAGDGPERLRVSDADRHQVAEVLREAAGEGRLDLDELDERLDAAYAAKVYADLVPLVVDLPGVGNLPDQVASQTPVPRSESSRRRPTGSSVAAARHDTSFTIMGGQSRKGVWRIGPTHTAFAMMGGIDLDLREAIFDAPEVLITATAVMGGIDIYVDEFTQVVVDGVGIMGAFEQGRDRIEPELDDSSPVVRVRGLALMGGVQVTRKPPPGELRNRARRHLGH